MKVLIVSHLYPNDANRISGIFVHYQVKELIKQGAEVRVISPVPYAPYILSFFNKKWKEYSKIPRYCEIDGVRVYHPRYIVFPRLMLYKYYGYNMLLSINFLIKKLYKNFKFDIIHSHVAFPEGFCGSILKRKYKVPHVVTIHGQDLQYTIKKGREFEKIIFDVLKDADSVITVSNKLKNLISDELLKNKVKIISNGVNIEDIENAKEFEHKKIDILSVSNLYKSKGIDLNILAVKKLIEEGYDVYYYVIGDGPERERLQRLAVENDLERNIIFLGRLCNREVLRYMKTAKIFCLPSYEEGFGIAYIEAMASGKPAIAIKGQGIEDAIKDGYNGLLVNPNVDEIYAALKGLIDNEDLRLSLGKRAKDTVYQGFTWQSSAKKLINIYKSLINK
ncbi:MAG: glycosyltransferase [Caloramator sp.]|nr:glycosyltransferase [Caloramator sp.]